MPRGDSWDTVEDVELGRLWMNGYSDIQIAEILERSEKAVASRRTILGMTRERDQITSYAPVVFPQFENITKAEARAITATISGSAKWTRVESKSGMGCTSVMVMEA